MTVKWCRVIHNMLVHCSGVHAVYHWRNDGFAHLLHTACPDDHHCHHCQSDQTEIPSSGLSHAQWSHAYSWHMLSLLDMHFPCEDTVDTLSHKDSPLSAREHCRISPPRFLADCHKKWLNQGSVVLLYFVFFLFFSGFSLVFVVSVLDLSSLLHFPVYTDINGTV